MSKMSKKKKQLQQYQINTLLRNKEIVLLYQHSNIKAQGWALIKQELAKRVSRELAIQSAPLLDGDSPKAKELKTERQAIVHSPTDSPPLASHSIAGDRGVLTLVIKNRIGQLSLTLPENSTPTSSLFTSFSERSAVGQLRPVKDGKRVESRPLPDSTGLLTKKPNRQPHGRTPLLQGSIFLLACNSHQDMVSAYHIVSKWRDSQGAGMVVLMGGFYCGRVVNHLDVLKLSTLTPLALGAIPLTLERGAVSLVNEQLTRCQRELLHCLTTHSDLLAASENAQMR